RRNIKGSGNRFLVLSNEDYDSSFPVLTGATSRVSKVQRESITPSSQGSGVEVYTEEENKIHEKRALEILSKAKEGRSPVSKEEIGEIIDWLAYNRGFSSLEITNWLSSPSKKKSKGGAPSTKFAEKESVLVEEKGIKSEDEQGLGDIEGRKAVGDCSVEAVATIPVAVAINVDLEPDSSKKKVNKLEVEDKSSVRKSVDERDSGNTVLKGEVDAEITATLGSLYSGNIEDEDVEGYLVNRRAGNLDPVADKSGFEGLEDSFVTAEAQRSSVAPLLLPSKTRGDELGNDEETGLSDVSDETGTTSDEVEDISNGYEEHDKASLCAEQGISEIVPSDRVESEVSYVNLKIDSGYDCFQPLAGNIEDVLNPVKMDEERTFWVGEIGKVSEGASKVFDGFFFFWVKVSVIKRKKNILQIYKGHSPGNTT
ncbi:hypothetical protein U1Q18_017931, partial [Sarracenia purpurea var. burkii]